MTAAAPPPSLFALPAFMRFWYARLTSTMGSQMLMVALGWQMYDLTGSAWDLGLIGLLQFLPSLLLTLVAGHVADHFDRSRVLALCSLTQLCTALILAAGTAQSWATRELLFVLSVVLGSAKAFQMPSQQSLVPLLVPQSMLARGLAFSSAGLQTAVISGPALGGFIYVAGPQMVYGVCAALFALAAGLFLRIGHPHVARAREPVTIGTLLAGVRFIWQRPMMLGAISLDLFAVLLGGATALLPIFAKDILHVGPWGLGLLRAAPAVGALLMSIALTQRPITRRVGRALLGAVAVFGLAMLVFAISRNLVLSIAALSISGAADMISVVIRQSLVQLETPDDMRGRVSAVTSVFIGASNQLGEFESGASAALFGPVGSVLLGGVGTLLVVGLWMRLFPSLARRQNLSGPD